MRKRILSFALVLCMLVTLVPVAVFANEVDKTTEYEIMVQPEEISVDQKNVAEADLPKLVEKTAEECDDDVAEPMQSVELTDTTVYYYNQLNEFEKLIYQKMESATWDNPMFEITLTQNFSDEDLEWQIRRAAAAFIEDDPVNRMKWTRYPSTWKLDNGILNIYMEKNSAASEYKIQKAIARAEQIAAEVGGDDLYTKVITLLDILAWNMTYDEYYVFAGKNCGTYNATALGPLLYNRGTCAGFSDTLKILCDMLDVPCVCVGNAGHAWNYVQLENGNWYAVDIVQIAGLGISESRLGKSMEDITEIVMCHSLWGADSILQGGDNYNLSELYIAAYNGNIINFDFPELSESTYNYSKDFVLSYSPKNNTFQEPEFRFTYDINTDGVSCAITGYEGEISGDLIIPDVIDGYRITEIQDAAFAYSEFEGELTIPNTVITIGPNAFKECTNLKKINGLPNSLESIGEGAFVGCTSLEGELEFPNGLRIIDKAAFYNDVGITGDLKLPESLETLGDSAFFGCSGLTGELFLPDEIEWNPQTITLTNISSIQISETNSNYEIYDGVLYTQDYETLLACPPGKNGVLKIKSGARKIGDTACAFCKNITSIEWNDTLQSIGSAAFRECTGVTQNLILPDSIECLEDYAFMDFGDENTKVLHLPNSLKSIGERAFCDCKFSGNLTIPNSVQIIGAGAFLNCNFGEYNYENNSIQNVKLTLPEGLETIGDWAFYCCYFSGTLTLPDSIKTIGSCAFEGNVFSEFSCKCGIEYKQEYGYYGLGQCYVMKCPNCHGSYSIGHSYTANISAPTCTEQGYTTYTCRCGDSYVADYTEALGHDYGSAVFTWDGFSCKATFTCTNCGDTQTLDCTVTSAVTKAATCTDTGARTYTASVVFEGKTYTADKAEILDALGHDYGEWTVTTAPTCTDKGVESRYCSRCDAYETREVEALGHSYTAKVTAPTCTEQGYTTYTCACGDSYVADYTDALGHDYGSAVFAWDGFSCKATFTCARCGDAQTLDCTITSAVTKAATCTDTGVRTYTASVVFEGKTYTADKAEILDALGHDYGKWTVTTAPTCTDKGVETRYCSRCDAYETREIAALGHDCVHHDAKAPTCTEIGWEAYDTCTRCDYTTYKEIPATDHSYTSKVTAPTCTEQGYTTYTCDCGDSYVADYVEALGHDYVDGICTRCGAWSEDIIGYGSCGLNVTWTLDKEGTLTISGTGRMALFDGMNNPDWYSIKDNIKAIVVEPGVTIIGGGAFKYCSNLTSVTIPDSVTSIESEAFINCSNLEDVYYAGTGDEWYAINIGDYNDKLLNAKIHFKSKPGYTNPFVDVSESTVYYDAVLWAYYHTPERITAGTDATHFSPNANCTRGQVVTFLWRAAGCPEPEGTCPFVDVSSTSPYYKAIIWAAEQGITNGVDATHFAPNATVTRAQFVTFLWRYEGKPEAEGTIDNFKDASSIATPFKEAVAWAVGEEIAGGYSDGTFRPNATCTRWAVVLFMYRDLA